jgi:copper transport protein
MYAPQRLRWRATTVLRLAGVAAMALCLLYRTVHAHANLVRAVPAPQTVLQQAPERVTLWFTEPIAPGLSTIQVLNAHGERVDNGVSTVEPSDLMVMSMVLHPLPEGTFTVVWHNLSTIDGHKVQGSFVFSVGTPTGGMTPLTVAQPPWFQAPVGPVLRWLVLVSALVLVGGLGFTLLVSRLLLVEKQGSVLLPHLWQPLAARTWQRLWVALAVLLAVSLGQLVVQAAVADERPLLENLGTSLTTVLTGTAWGHLWLWRVGALVVLAVVLRRSAGVGYGKESGEVPARGLHWGVQILTLGLGGGMLLTLSLVSHAAAAANIRAAAICADYLHLAAAAFWLGGLFHLASDVPYMLRTLSVAERCALLAALVPRFSILAALCVGTLILTGLYGAWVQVTVLPALRTPYGVTLLIKLALFTPLLVLGALNLWWVRPQLAYKDSAGRWLSRLIMGEVVLGTLVLLAVGCLTSLEPARQAATRQGILSTPGLSFQDMADGTHIRLAILPGWVGPNSLVITLTDHWGTPIRQAADVNVRLRYLDTDIGASTFSALARMDGSYGLDTVFLSMAGRWEVQLLVRRPDAFDARTSFPVTMVPASADDSTAMAPTRHTGMLLWGGTLVLLGGLCLLTGIPLRGWRTLAGTLAIGCGVLLTLAGCLVIHVQLMQGGT